jgi:hypothetical protein
MSTIQPTMMIVSGKWNNSDSFKLVPLTKDCPYSEGFYDLDSKVLVLMSMHTKDNFHLLPRLDDNGDPIQVKGQTRPNKKAYKEQRVQLETYTEYYISETKEIEDLLNITAINANSFDYKRIINGTPVKATKAKEEAVKA